MIALLSSSLARYAVAGAIAFIAGFGLAWKLQGGTIARMESAQFEALAIATEQGRLDQKRADKVSLDFTAKESSDQQTETAKTVTITKWAYKNVPIIANCPGPDLVRLHDAAATGADPESIVLSTGQPDGGGATP